MLITKLFLTGILVLVISSISFAGEPAEHPKTGDPLVIDCFKGTPKLDGNLSDWNLNYLTPAVLDTKEQIYAGVAPGAAGWTGPKDSSAKFYLLWDEKYIYIGLDMKDDKISMTKSGGDIWNADGVEVFFSTTEAVPAGDHSQHYQYGFNANNAVWNWCNMDGAGSKEPAYMKCTTTKAADGYVCEVSIEHGQIKSLEFKAGNAIGFHPAFDDADDTADRKLQMTWTGLEAHDQSTSFGRIILKNENAAVDSSGKASITWGAIKE